MRPTLGMEVGFSLVTLSPGHPGGSETYVRGLLAGFAEQPADGDRITVLADAGVARAYSHLDDGGIRLAPGDRRPVGRSRAARAAAFGRSAVRRARVGRELPSPIDVMHYPLTVPLPRVAGPSVVTVHDLNHRDLRALWSPAERTYRRLVYEGAARRAAIIVTPAEYSRRRLIATVGVDPGRVVAIAHGVDARFSPDPGPVDGRLPVPESCILYPAADWPHKNHERLVRAFAAARPDGVALVLTGNRGAHWARVQALGEALGLAERPSSPRAGRRRRHARPVPASAGATVFPSLYEGWGFRRWRPWPAVARWPPPCAPRCAKHAETRPSASTPRTKPRSPAPWCGSSRTTNCGGGCASAAWRVRGRSPGSARPGGT